MASVRKAGLFGLAAPLVLAAQISIDAVSTSPTQAILQYTSPVENACSLQVGDMNRAITITSGTQASGQVTIHTAGTHGLLAGAVIYIENSDMTAWNGWQTIVSVPTSTSFTFANTSAGVATLGNVGVLVDDVNTTLFPGSNLDSRSGNVTSGARGSGKSRTFVVGFRSAQFASDGNRHSRALQANSRHHYTLTCGMQSYDQVFQTQNIPLGGTYNEGLPSDHNNPGQYAYPTPQWTNPSAAMIDPLTGLRSFLLTTPPAAPSLTQTLVTAIDLQSAWQNPTGPLTTYNGAAMFTGPCPSGTCPLFLRADNFSLPGGAAYVSAQDSLNWFTVTVSQASISNSACAGDDCRIVACLTVNGQTCASANQQVSLTSTPATYTFGTQNMMDLWQGSGTPGITSVDATQATGTVNYTAATMQATVTNGSPFNIKWTAGSTINVAGGQYTIASVQNEKLLTLVSGPTSNLTGVSYTANNFGVLIWKKTATADRISIGYTTYVYGAAGMPAWTAAATNSCSPVVDAFGKAGFHCFIGSELFWVAADGSIVNDLGLVQTTYNGVWGTQPCGSSLSAYSFDPLDGNTWYCTLQLYFSSRISFIKVHYNGSNSPFTPGATIPDCASNHSTKPCNSFTVMQPNASDDITVAAPLFNPEYATSQYAAFNWQFWGISPDGDAEIAANRNQDTPGWMFLYTLGDRTPTGTDANSMHIIAGGSTYLHAPLSWCTIHDNVPPVAGWVEVLSNNLTIQGNSGRYTMSITSGALTKTAGGTGGLNACPTNPLGVTGNSCTNITVNGPPTNAATGSAIQNVQVGDLLLLDSETMRVVAMTSLTSLTVQRGYPLPNTLAAHGSTTLLMQCGTASQNALVGLWNYRNDPYGLNASWSTIVSDQLILGGHTYIDAGTPPPTVTISTDGNCPASCDEVRPGYMSTAIGTAVQWLGNDPPFAGIVGAIGQPNSVDSHPGPCFGQWCMDARPFLGNDGSAVTLGGGTNFVNTTGQLWKVAGASSVLHRKVLTTMAYVGRNPLVDVSGPSSVISPGAAGSYTYCYALLAGECVAGSAQGDVYVNTPYVAHPFCSYPGIAEQTDDTNGICIGDLGAYAGNLAQLGVVQPNLVGSGIRRLGSNYARWNQFDAFWNSTTTPTGLLMGTRVRWLDGISNAFLATVLPPFPASDGVNRATFIPVPVSIQPPAGLRVQTAFVEFGYAENGGTGTYYCTSRQETCVATAATINQTTPFYYEQSETYSGVSCSNGCTVALPGLSQKVVYYRWKYLGSSGQVVGVSLPAAVITP